MEKNFNLKNYLTENKLTRNSQMLSEEPVRPGPGELPTGTGENPAFQKTSERPVKFSFSDEKSEPGRFYLPYIGKLREIGVQDASIVAEMVALLVLDKLKKEFANETYPGSNVGFRAEVMVPIIGEVLQKMGVGNVNETTRDYIARHIFQACEDAKCIEVTGGRKSNAGQPRTGIALQPDMISSIVGDLKADLTPKVQAKKAGK